MVKSNRYEREHKAGDFNWLIVKKKKSIKYLCGADLPTPVWSAGPWLFAELNGCQAGFQLPPVTLTTAASGLLGPFAKPWAPIGSSEAQEPQPVATRELHSILPLLMVLLVSRETTSCLGHSHSLDQRHLDFSHYSICTWSHSEN